MNGFFKGIITFLLSVLTSIGIYHGTTPTNKNVVSQNQTLAISSPVPFQYSRFDTVHGKSGSEAILFVSVCAWGNNNAGSFTGNTIRVLNDFAQKGYLQYSIREISQEPQCSSDEKNLAAEAFTSCLQEVSPQSYEQYLLSLGSVLTNPQPDYSTFVQTLKNYLPSQFVNQIISCVQNKDYQKIIQSNEQFENTYKGGDITSVPTILFPNSSAKTKIVDGEIIDDNDGFKRLAPFVNFPNSTSVLSPDAKLQQQLK